MDEPSEQGNGSLEHTHGQSGKDASATHRCGHDADDECVECALEREGGPITGKAVLNGSNDGHRPDAYGERGGYEGVHERGVSGVARALFEPNSEPLEFTVEVDELSNERARCKRGDD